jgi:CRISPR-associated protein Cas5h
MRLVCFELTGRYGHFLRAEGGVSATTYPVPPRTAVLGLLGAVLGLEKDVPQVLLDPAHIAVKGRLPQIHWHTAKFRQETVERVPLSVSRRQKDTKQTSIAMPKIIAQEWLFLPKYTIWCSVPEPYQTDLEMRLRERRWFFQPSLGLSEMMADLSYIATEDACPLADGSYYVDCVFPTEDAALNMDRIFEQKLVVHSLRMPRMVTPDRVFSHEAYYMERDSRPIPVNTRHAFQTSREVLMFL